MAEEVSGGLMKPAISIALITLGLTLCPPAQAFWWGKYPSRIEAEAAKREWLNASDDFDYEYLNHNHYKTSDKQFKLDKEACLEELQPKIEKYKHHTNAERAYFGTDYDLWCLNKARYLLDERNKPGVIDTASMKTRYCEFDGPTRQYICYEAQLRRGAKYSKALEEPFMPEFKVVKRFKW